MKVIKKYIDDFEQVDLSLVEYVEINLEMRRKTLYDLQEIFEITKAAIDKWKKFGEGIDFSKQIYLSRMFGLTLDQFYEREIEDDYLNDEIYRISILDNLSNVKGMKSFYLEGLRQEYAKTEYYISNELKRKSEKEDYTEFGVYPDEFDYYCKCLHINYNYRLNAKSPDDISLVLGGRELSFDSLREAIEEMRISWGDINLNEKLKYSFKYKFEELLLLSENLNSIKNYIEEYKNQSLYLPLYKTIKDENEGFDKNGVVLKLLVSLGCAFMKENVIDYKKTFSLVKIILENEISNMKFEEE